MDYNELLKLILSSPFGVQLLITVAASIYFIFVIFKIKDFEANRKIMTTQRAMSFADALLSRILSSCVEQMRAIHNNREMSEIDRLEILLIRFALYGSLYLETKSGMRAIIMINGYVQKSRDGEDYSGIVKNRAAELHGISIITLEGLVRSTSPLRPLIGKMISKEGAEDLTLEFVKYHINEVKNEEDEINDLIKEKLGVLSRFYKYKHQ